VDQTWLFALLSLELSLKSFGLRSFLAAPLREKLLFDSVNAHRFEKHFSRGGATAQRNSF
jgi:hypothetical protein